jgi:branched-chain amino acid transport system substrate-binding protein
MIRHRMSIAACVFAAASLGLTACASSSSGSGSSGAKGPFTILAIVAASGPLASVSAAEIDGMKVAASYVDAHGGILGQKIKITVDNDNDDPSTAASLLQAAVSSGNKPDMVFAGTTSTETLAMMPILTQNKIFSLQISVSSQTIIAKTNPYAFSSSTQSSVFATELASAVKKLYPKTTKVGMLMGNDVTGQSLLSFERPALEAEGFSVVVQQYDPTTAIDLTPQLEALKAANPNLLIVSGFGQIAGYILKSRYEIGWNIPTVGDSDFSANDLTALASPQELTNVSILEPNKSLLYKPFDQQGAAFQTLYKAVAPKSGTFEAPFDLYELGWDDIFLAKAAATQAGSFASAALTHALENLKATTSPDYFDGPYRYSAAQHTPFADLSLATLASPYDKDGQSLPFGQK